jgi:hypothetical protein
MMTKFVSTSARLENAVDTVKDMNINHESA